MVNTFGRKITTGSDFSEGLKEESSPDNAGSALDDERMKSKNLAQQNSSRMKNRIMTGHADREP